MILRWIKLRTNKPIFVDSYIKNRETGSLILIDEGTNETVAAGHDYIKLSKGICLLLRIKLFYF